MKASKLFRILVLAMLSLWLSQSFDLAEAKGLPAQPATRSGCNTAETRATSLASVLNPDGTVNLAVAGNNSFDARADSV
jgi:hypothetical protein